MGSLIVLAAGVPWESADLLRERMADAGGGGGAVVLLVAIGAVAAAAFAAIVVAALRRDHNRLGPAYRRLSGALGLGFRERRLVARCARSAGLRTPASMLVGCGCFDHALARYTARYGTEPRLERVRAIVHGPRVSSAFAPSALPRGSTEA